MPSIVPISDLKNYSEVLRSCDQGATVYLTKKRAREICRAEPCRI